MSVVMTEKQMQEICSALLPDEEVLVTGLFQPYGSGVAMGTAMGGTMSMADDLHIPGVAGGLISAAAGLASQRGLAKAEHQPQWTVIAVTDEHVYAFDATGKTGMSVSHNFTGPPYATWDRDKITVHMSRYVMSFTLTIDDHVSGTSWDYKGNEIYKMGGKLVAHLLIPK